MKDSIATEIRRLANEIYFRPWPVIENNQRLWFLQRPGAVAAPETYRPLNVGERSLNDEEAFVLLYRIYLSKKARTGVPSDYVRKSESYRKLFGEHKL